MRQFFHGTNLNIFLAKICFFSSIRTGKSTAHDEGKGTKEKSKTKKIHKSNEEVQKIQIEILFIYQIMMWRLLAIFFPLSFV